MTYVNKPVTFALTDPSLEQENGIVRIASSSQTGAYRREDAPTPSEKKRYSVGPFRIWSRSGVSKIELQFSDATGEYILLLPTSGIAEFSTEPKLLRSDPRARLIRPNSRNSTLRVHKEHEHICIAFDKSAIVGELSRLLDEPVMDNIDFATTVARSSLTGCRLIHLGNVAWKIVDVANDDSASITAAKCLLRALLVMLLESVPHNYSARLDRTLSPATPRNLKRAIEFMLANVSRTITIGEIAKESGTSVRALQLAFQQFKNITPMNYLRQMRLEGVHRTLSDEANSLSISEVARSWGFTHMGRFAANYCDAYGQSPSETVRRHRECKKIDS